ncbi:MAG: polyhydroxyalkanoate biosynthesis repressor PhaR [Flammeovirgaceae bacterium]|nr:polyhydroxyalkanoate biosynthesis repressor PhaR [Flammeovirgaceae bacterium]
MTSNQMCISGRRIGPEFRPFVIAEIGINHEGSYQKALQMVYDAHAAGAECVKFQCHILEDEMTPDAQNTIPSNSDKSIYEIMNRCLLSHEEEIALQKVVDELGMIYLSTPFSRAAADRLEEMGVEAYKIGSGECNNYPLIEHVAKFGKPIILSTGMNNISSIQGAVEILERYDIDYALLHCTSLYPTPYEQVRLGAIAEMKEAFPNAVLGLSDHSIGNYTCFGAVPLGASILEKHFTSDKSWPGPDIEISVDPQELSELVKGSAAIHSALGGNKTILKAEQPTIDFAYASVVTIKTIKEGDRFTKDNIWVKRPGTGELLAAEYNNILGLRATRDLENDCQLKRGDIV